MSDPLSGATIPHLTHEPNQYKKARTLAINATAAVILVQRLLDGANLVLKRVNVDNMEGKERQDALNEVRILALLHHPNIIQYHESFLRDGFLNIVMEYASEGDLNHQIQMAVEAGGRPFPERLVLSQFCQVALALQYIHSVNVLHRDLKTQNVFLTSGGVVKLGDFGIAKLLANHQDYARTIVGTPYYMSPELCEDQSYNSKSDMWALGCILYEMCSFRPPFEGNGLPALVNQIVKVKHSPVPACYTPHIHQLVDDLLQKDSALRPSAAQLLQREYLHRFILQSGLPGFTYLSEGANVLPIETPSTQSARPPLSSHSPPSTAATTNAQWMAQKMGEILEIQGDLEAKYPDKLNRRHSGNRFCQGPQRFVPTAPAPTASMPHTAPRSQVTPSAGPNKRCTTPATMPASVPLGQGCTKKEGPVRHRFEPSCARSSSTSVIPSSSQHTEEHVKPKAKIRAKSPCAVSRSLSDLHAERRTSMKAPPSREELISETQARRDRRERERQEQAEAQARHRQEMRNVKSRVKVERRPCSSTHADVEVEVYVCNLELHPSPKRPTTAPVPTAPTPAPPAAPPSSRIRSSSAGRDRRNANSNVTHEDGKLRTPSKSWQQLRQQMRADREANRGRIRGEGVAVELYIPHKRSHTAADGSDQGVKVHYMGDDEAPLSPTNVDASLHDSPAPLPQPYPQPSEPTPSQPSSSKESSEDPATCLWPSNEETTKDTTAPFMPNTSVGGSQSVPSSDESPGNISPVGRSDPFDSDNDVDDFQNAQAALLSNRPTSSNPAWISYSDRPAPPQAPRQTQCLPRQMLPQRPLPARHRTSFSAPLRSCTGPNSPAHISAMDLDIPELPDEELPHQQAPMSTPYSTYIGRHPATVDASVLGSPPSTAVPINSPGLYRYNSLPSSDFINGSSPLYQPRSKPHTSAANQSMSPRPPSPSSAPTLSPHLAGAGQSPLKMPPPVSEKSALLPEGRTKNTLWLHLLETSEHRKFSQPEELDQLLDCLQSVLLPRDPGSPGGSCDLKVLAPEDRLKIRIRALQQLGEQVLGPRLFSQMYAALKKPMDSAKRELLDIAQHDAVLHAAVVHINQLLLCESLYFG